MTRATITRKIRVYDPSALPAYMAGKPLWEWFDVPNTALSSIAPSPTPWGAVGPRAKVDAWCGMAMKRSGSMIMLGAAGGHGDYAGNEVNALTLSADAPAWSELKAPTPYAQIYNATEVYGDLTRAAVHTYYMTQFDEARNRMLIVGGGGMYSGSLPPYPADWPWPTGVEGGVIMAFSLDTNEWLHPNTLSQMPTPGNSTPSSVCTDPASGYIYRLGNGSYGMRRYDPSEDVWSSIGVSGMSGGYCGMAVDPARKKILQVGGYNIDTDPKVFDIATGSDAGVTFSGLGPTALRDNVHPGVVYDEANDCFLVMLGGYFASTGMPAPPNDTAKVLRVDPVTWAVTQPTITGSLPSKRQNGTLNAFLYAPELRGVVFVNSYSGNVKFMRTA